MSWERNKTEVNISKPGNCHFGRWYLKYFIQRLFKNKDLDEVLENRYIK